MVVFCLTLPFSYAKEDKVRVIILPGKDKSKFHISSVLTDIEKIKNFKNGIVARVSRKNVELLKSLGFRVFEDYKVRAFLTESVPLIKANSVWKIRVDNNNITGKNISVCIVDTGVNYTQPDLGGCFGTGCKVIGGYDFVNSDSDPMDDNGHGTHVAGIIAANGTLKGVAPDANIVAVKVLDSQGYGYASDVLSGIEWCVNNSDKYNIKVISLSLGTNVYTSYCDADELLFSEAINSAVSKGIAVVAATGNEGNYSGVASPSCVYNATRVAATYKRNYATSLQWCLDVFCSRTCTDSNPKIDNITCFSNRGAGFNDILLAPGVDVNSTYIYGYSEETGTSMAAPHVSGAIALIKQIAPQLSPKEIEKLLNETGKVVFDPTTGRNYTRIDVYAAISKLKPQLFDQKVIPLLGNLSTIFNFSVNYTHAANVSPVYVKVCIDGICYNTSSSSYDFVHGSIFSHITNLSYGMHYFYFETFDGTYHVNTSIAQFPWVADRFWLSSEEKINYSENLTGKYVIANSSLLNVTGNLILKNSFVKNLNDLNISVYGNLSVLNTSFENFTVLNIFAINKNVSAILGKNIEITGDMNINITNSSINSTFLHFKNSNGEIMNSTLPKIYLAKSSLYIENSTISYLEVIGNSSIKGYLYVENISIKPGIFLERYFPLKLISDINGTPVERNVTLWNGKALFNFTTNKGFVWINASFSLSNESYKIYIRGYGFAKIKGKNLTLTPDYNTTQNITLDVVIPRANVSISELFVSPLASPGIKDNTTIILNSSEPLERQCILINSSSETSYSSCGNVFVWNASSDKDGVYSLWINLTDFFQNTNLTKVGEIIVDNTLPEINTTYIPKLVINGSKVNITVIIAEQNLNSSWINISSQSENVSIKFSNYTSFIFIPNYTENYTIEIFTKDNAGNTQRLNSYFISRPEVKTNITLLTNFSVKIKFMYSDSLINETLLSSNTSLPLPDNVYNISLRFNNSIIELNDVNVSENKNMSFRIERVEETGFLKTYAFDVDANFSIAYISINYSDTPYTNENYLAVYRCDNWNFSLKRCDSSWMKENALINKTLKIVRVNTTHFSAFSLKQEPYCGDGIVNQQSEECDKNDFLGKTCASFGYDYGSLSCTAQCKISTASCGYYSSTSTSYSPSFISLKEVQKNRNVSFAVPYIFCPGNLVFSSKNISFKIVVGNKGNKSSEFNFSISGGLNFKRKIYLKGNESIEMSFNYSLSPGNYSVVASLSNVSCRFEVSVILPEIYYELEKRVKYLEKLAAELNISSDKLEKAKDLLEQEKYEEVKIILSDFEKKLNNTLIQTSKEVEESKRKNWLDELIVFISIVLITVVIFIFARKP